MFMKRGYDLFFEMLHPPSTMEVIHGLLLPRIGASGFCTQHVLMHDPVIPLKIKQAAYYIHEQLKGKGGRLGSPWKGDRVRLLTIKPIVLPKVFIY